jgi:hypothetical protein
MAREDFDFLGTGRLRFEVEAEALEVLEVCDGELEGLDE